MDIKTFRGQYGSTVARIQSKLPSITFGSLETAKLYSTHPNNSKDTIIKSIVLSVVIQIMNPIINNADDCFAEFDLLIEKLGAEFMWYMAEKHSDYIYITDNWEENYSNYVSISGLKQNNPKELSNLYMNAYVLLDDEELITRSKELGYDGAIHIGNGLTLDELEYRIFSEEQIIHIEELLSC